VHRKPAEGINMVNLTQKHVGLSRPQSEAAANGLPHPIGRQRSLITR